MVILTAITASAGWIMVQSGLVNRPWVNAYKLTLHFILAVLTIAAMVKCIADVYQMENKPKKGHTRFVVILLIFTFIQLVFAGLMAGMRAGLYYATWPSMNGTFIPQVLLESSNWTWHNLTNYDRFAFAPALVQFVHRMLAYILLFLTFFFYHKKRNQRTYQCRKMANRILSTGCISGFSWHYDPDQSKNRDSVILWNAAPTGWTVIPDQPLVSLLFL